MTGSNKKYSRYIYAALKKACSNGTASTKVKTSTKSQNGHKVWNRLCKFYEGIDTVEQQVTDITDALTSLKLEYNSGGGFSKYLQRFEKLNLRLAEMNHGLSDLQKKTFFINGIKDRDYNPTIAICRDDPKKSYDRCVNTLHAEARRLNKLSENRKQRRGNMKSRKGKGKNQHKDNESRRRSNNANISNSNNSSDRQGAAKPLSNKIWHELGPKQKAQWLKGREVMSNQTPQQQQYGGQYSSQRTSNNANSGDRQNADDQNGRNHSLKEAVLYHPSIRRQQGVTTDPDSESLV